MADYLHEDNTGHGGSVEFMERRKRGEALVASWRRAEFDTPAAETIIPARAERSSRLGNLRSRLRDNN